MDIFSASNTRIFGGLAIFFTRESLFIISRVLSNVSLGERAQRYVAHER